MHQDDPKADKPSPFHFLSLEEKDECTDNDSSEIMKTFWFVICCVLFLFVWNVKFARGMHAVRLVLISYLFLNEVNGDKTCYARSLDT